MTHNLNRHFRPQATEGQGHADWYFPLSGWLLTALVGLEEDAPGTLLHAFKSKSLWRNAVAISLATGALDRPGRFLLRAYGEVDDSEVALPLRVQFAKAICTMKPQHIVEAALGDVPPSLLGSMKKIGWEVLTTPDAYRRLVDLLRASTPEGRFRRRVLEQTNSRRLTDDTLQVIECLDLAILSPLTAAYVSSAAEAHRLNSRLALIRRMVSTVNDAALKESADAMGSRFNASQYAKAWLAKADRLQPLGLPIDDDPDLLRLTPASAEPMGRRFRNCLAGYGLEMAAGATAFFTIESLSVVVVVKFTDSGWMLTGVHTYANGRVSREVLMSVKEKLTGLGVLCILPIAPPGDVALATGAFMRVDALEFDFEGLDPHG